MRPLLGTFDAGPPAAAALDDVIDRALAEDRAHEDRSTLPLPARGELRRGRIVAREDGVLAGVAAVRRVFRRLGGGDAVSVEGAADGARFARGDEVLTLAGPVGILLSGERTALNLLQRLSGIATATRRAVDAAGGRLAVCDTRKTTPGLRALEKWAVVLGGGTSHRWSLADMVLLKENHLALAGGVTAAVAAVRADPESARLPLTVEVRTFDEAVEAAALGVDRLLLDNMSPSGMARVAERLGPRASRPELEASGGIGPGDLAAVAATGVDLVSLGSLTHSVKAIDFSFLLDEARP
jgi:nicotinate-nucleotide pyrophosphorylase (carboxylating)